METKHNFEVVPMNDTEKLIDWLNALYPEKCPDPKDTEREIWMKAGERRVVRSLIAKLTHTSAKKMLEERLLGG